MLKIVAGPALCHGQPPTALMARVRPGVSVPIEAPANRARSMGIRLWLRYPMVDGARCEVALHMRLPGLVWVTLQHLKAESQTRHGLLTKPGSRPYWGFAVHHMPHEPGAQFFWSVAEMTGGQWLYHAHVGG